MSLTWSHEYFDQKYDDAYADWLSYVSRNFPTQEEDYIVPAVWFGRPGFRNNFEEIFFPAGGGGKAEDRDIPPYVAELFLDAPPQFSGEEVVPTHFPLKEWRQLVDGPNSPLKNSLVEQVIVGRPVPADSVIYRGTELEIQELAYSDDEADEIPVIVGIIDEGLAFANERFRNGPTDTRVEFAWLQGGRSVSGGVYGFNRGFELTKWDRTIEGKTVPGIDSLLKLCRKGDLVDEDLFYALAGVADFGRLHHKAAAWRVSHGTHVMDLAAGYDMGEDKKKRHIISVQLPSAIVAETSGLGLETELVNAVGYIFHRAYAIRKRYGYDKVPPIVINFSSGIRAGPHDGSSSIEQYLDRILNYWRDNHSQVQFVLPAGNSFQARSHACFSFNNPSVPPGQSIDKVDWHVPPDDRTSSYIELWLPQDLCPEESKKISVTICAPSSTVSSCELVADRNNPGQASIALRESEVDEGLVCKAYFQQRSDSKRTHNNRDEESKMRGRYLIALVPTSFHSSKAALAGAGVWSISVKYTGVEALELHGWIHWDDAPISYSRFGRQSFFEDPHYRKFSDSGEYQEVDHELSAIRRTGTISAIATGNEVRVVGGYRISDGRIATYSSADFKGHEDLPNYLAPSETSKTNLGLIAAGSRSGSAVPLNGTSVAAPQITRLIADLMACGEDDDAIVDLLRDKAVKDDIDIEHSGRRRTPPGTTPKLSKERKGAGRLKLPESRPSNSLRGDFGT